MADLLAKELHKGVSLKLDPCTKFWKSKLRKADSEKQTGMFIL